MPPPELLKPGQLSSTIVSDLFWPPFQGDSVKLPAAVQRRMEEYTAEYGKLKAPRKLLWKHNLGLVKLKLEFTTGEVEAEEQIV